MKIEVLGPGCNNCVRIDRNAPRRSPCWSPSRDWQGDLTTRDQAYGS